MKTGLAFWKAVRHASSRWNPGGGGLASSSVQRCQYLLQSSDKEPIKVDLTQEGSHLLGSRWNRGLVDCVWLNGVRANAIFAHDEGKASDLGRAKDAFVSPHY